VYIVRTGDNPELLYSLRSLSNLDFSGNVFIYGYKPDFVTNVTYVPLEQNRGAAMNSLTNMLTACKDDRVSDPFILLHDDFCIKEPVDEILPKHRGDYSEMNNSGSSWHQRRMQRTADWLRGNGFTTLNYELHMPVIIHKADFLKIEEVDRPYMYNKLSLYGNMSGLGGEKVADVKATRIDDIMPEGPFVATSELTFEKSPIGKAIREMFPGKSVYEI